MLRFEGFSGVEEDLDRGLPVARRATTPAFGMLSLGGLIEGVAPGQQVDVLAAMALFGGDELQATMVVLGVVPALDFLRPAAGLI